MLVRLTGEEFGSGDKVFKLQSFDDQDENNGISVKLSAAAISTQDDKLTIRNQGNIDIFAWRLGCNFKFSLKPGSGEPHTPTAGRNGTWDVHVEAHEEGGILLRGSSQSFQLRRETNLPMNPRCTLNDVPVDVDVAAP